MERFPLFGLLLLAFLSIAAGAVKIIGWFRGSALEHLSADDWQRVVACSRSLASRCAYSEPVEALLQVEFVSIGQGAVAGLVIAVALLVSQLARTSTRSFLLLLVLLLAFAFAVQFAHLRFAELADHFVRSSVASVAQDCLEARTNTSCSDYAVRMQGIRYGALFISKAGFAILAVFAVSLSAALALGLGAKRPRGAV
ncbi:hypothetical protein [Pseudomonas sp.]|uniref:hypothetical protein n=1 Tax=Pseudomonas sp. TaxID=306 RepID=UPI0028AB1C62|nr:hypothetical protein [Pseudomonas sp.]